MVAATGNANGIIDFVEVPTSELVEDIIPEKKNTNSDSDSDSSTSAVENK